MKFSLATKLATEDNTHCLVVPVVSGKQLPDVTKQVDQASGGAITAAIKAGDASTSRGKTLLLRSLAGIKSDRVLLVGCGKPGELTATQYVDILRAAGRAVKSLGAASATCHLNDLEVAGQNNHWKLAMAVQTLAHCNYRFDELKSAKSSPAKLKRIALGMADTSAAAAKQARATITTHSAIADGVKLARDLGNRPGNVCTPVYLADQAKQVAAELDLKLTSLMNPG